MNKNLDVSQESIDEELNLLLHEVSNPLMLAISLVEIMVTNPKVQKLDEVHESLKRVCLAVAKLKKFNTQKPD